jgi:Tetratricopeptide repeat
MNQMKVSGTGCLVALLLSVLVEGTALARDVYKGSLDPGIPRHRAVLDTLSQLEANPKDAGLKNDLGCLIAQEGFWRDALREFDEAADLDRKTGHPYFNAGLVKAAKGEWRGARSYFQRATKRDPGNWPAWWMVGFAEEQLGNKSAAVAAYKVSLRVDTSLFDVAVNPFAAWTNLKVRVFMETYDARRARATLPTSEQLDDPDRVASFFQKTKRGSSSGEKPAPAPTPERKTGPVVSSIPAESSGKSTATSGPVWNPREPNLRRRDETRPGAVPPAQPTEPPPTPPTPPAPPAPGTQPGVNPGDGQPPFGANVPGPGGPGGRRFPTPTPTPPN